MGKSSRIPNLGLRSFSFPAKAEGLLLSEACPSPVVAGMVGSSFDGSAAEAAEYASAGMVGFRGIRQGGCEGCGSAAERRSPAEAIPFDSGSSNCGFIFLFGFPSADFGTSGGQEAIGDAAGRESSRC